MPGGGGARHARPAVYTSLGRRPRRPRRVHLLRHVAAARQRRVRDREGVRRPRDRQHHGPDGEGGGRRHDHPHQDRRIVAHDRAARRRRGSRDRHQYHAGADGARAAAHDRRGRTAAGAVRPRLAEARGRLHHQRRREPQARARRDEPDEGQPLRHPRRRAGRVPRPAVPGVHVQQVHVRSPRQVHPHVQPRRPQEPRRERRGAHRRSEQDGRRGVADGSPRERARRFRHRRGRREPAADNADEERRVRRGRRGGGPAEIRPGSPRDLRDPPGGRAPRR